MSLVVRHLYTGWLEQQIQAIMKKMDRKYNRIKEEISRENRKERAITMIEFVKQIQTEPTSTLRHHPEPM